MKTISLVLVPALLLVAAWSAKAFDSNAWERRRQVLTHEAERLRAEYRATIGRVDEPAENVTIPVETREDGAITLSISASKAQVFLSEDLVWAEGVVVRKLGEDGREMSRIEAAHCLFDRTTKSGWAEGRAKVIHGKTVFDGEDVYFSAEEGYVMALSSARIKSKDLRVGGVL